MNLGVKKCKYLAILTIFFCVKRFYHCPVPCGEQDSIVFSKSSRRHHLHFGGKILETAKVKLDLDFSGRVECQITDRSILSDVLHDPDRILAPLFRCVADDRNYRENVGLISVSFQCSRF